MFFRDSSRDYQPARRSDPGRAGSRPEDRRYAASSRPEAEDARKLPDKREDKRAPPRRVRERVCCIQSCGSVPDYQTWWNRTRIRFSTRHLIDLISVTKFNKALLTNNSNWKKKHISRLYIWIMGRSAMSLDLILIHKKNAKNIVCRQKF